MGTEAPQRDPRLVEAARKAGEFYNGKGGFENGGRLNLYQCQHDPAHVIITVDREPGVTPFTVQCPHCEAAGTLGKGFYRHPEMQSAVYRVHPGLTPTHEWYRPDSLAGFKPGMVNHLLKGGLALRKIGTEPLPKDPDHAQ